MLVCAIIGWGFCDIQNNRGQGKDYQPKGEADNPYLDLDCSEYHKTESDNCFIIHWMKKIVMFLPLHWRQAAQSAQSWHDYP